MSKSQTYYLTHTNNLGRGAWGGVRDRIDNGANRFMARSRIRLAEIVFTICTSNDTIGSCHKYL